MREEAAIEQGWKDYVEITVPPVSRQEEGIARPQHRFDCATSQRRARVQHFRRPPRRGPPDAMRLMATNTALLARDRTQWERKPKPPPPGVLPQPFTGPRGAPIARPRSVQSARGKGGGDLCTGCAGPACTEGGSRCVLCLKLLAMLNLLSLIYFRLICYLAPTRPFDQMAHGVYI